MSLSLLFRILLIGLAAIGVFGGGSLSLSHWHTGDTCPMLGPLPACYLVFAAYSLVVISALLPTGHFNKLFYVGWTPIFALAFIGVILHTFVGDTCPVNENGLPQCYLSLALAIGIFVTAFFAWRQRSALTSVCTE